MENVLRSVKSATEENHISRRGLRGYQTYELRAHPPCVILSSIHYSPGYALTLVGENSLSITSFSSSVEGSGDGKATGRGEMAYCLGEVVKVWVEELDLEY